MRQETRPGQGADIAEVVRSHFTPSTSGSKYEILIEGIKSALAAGQLRAGDQLPPEQEFAAKTGMSLGTVRRCLQRLAADGIVSREHGRGTFISSRTQSVDDLWHFRFLDTADRRLLPVKPHVIERRLIKSEGAWSRTLGPSSNGYVRIRRLIDVDSRFTCLSTFYLSGDLFAPILDVTANEIEGTGLKNVIAEHFHVPTLSFEKTARCEKVPASVAKLIKTDECRCALSIEIVAKSFREEPVSYHVVHAPVDAPPMDVWSTPPAKSFEKGHLK